MKKHVLVFLYDFEVKDHAAKHVKDFCHRFLDVDLLAVHCLDCHSFGDETEQGKSCDLVDGVNHATVTQTCWLEETFKKFLLRRWMVKLWWRYFVCILGI